MRLIITFVSTDNVGGEFTAPPPTCPCDTITFECTVAGDTNGGTWWRLDDGSTSCTLLHEDTSIIDHCSVFTAMFENTSATSFPTTLSSHKLFTATDQPTTSHSSFSVMDVAAKGVTKSNHAPHCS